MRRQKRREAHDKQRKKRTRLRFSVSTDVRNKALQAFWAMHVEAMTWSGMGVREYAAALQLSPYSLRRWRDHLDEAEVEIKWRAHLHPSARLFASTSAKQATPKSSLTAPPSDDPVSPRQPVRRFFSDEQKRAIALESDQPGVSVSRVARKYGIVAGMLFRWRVQFGVARKKRAQLAPVTLPDDAGPTRLLRDLVHPPKGMVAVDLLDGRRVFAPTGRRWRIFPVSRPRQGTLTARADP
ncbi:transposase [Bradyrhizobium erythrophlei]|uniref:transposase n=1 Tax=Bradyrhizobium erythrophlei TaxID=1437360 RepID=UPI0035EE615F